MGNEKKDRRNDYVKRAVLHITGLLALRRR
jgi:hypothetical protein